MANTTRNTNLTKGMRSTGGSSKVAVQEGKKAPGQGAEGFSEYEVGAQSVAAAAPGHEGAHSIDVQIAAGAVESHESFSDPMKNGYTGLEK